MRLRIGRTKSSTQLGLSGGCSWGCSRHGLKPNSFPYSKGMEEQQLLVKACNLVHGALIKVPGVSFILEQGQGSPRLNEAENEDVHKNCFISKAACFAFGIAQFKCFALILHIF